MAVKCGRVVRAPDLKSGGPGFKSRSDRHLELFHGRPELNSSATLANSQLACLLSVGIFNLVMFTLKYLFRIFECSAPLAYCYHHLPRVNKGHLFLFVILCLLSWLKHILPPQSALHTFSCPEALQISCSSSPLSKRVADWGEDGRAFN